MKYSNKTVSATFRHRHCSIHEWFRQNKPDVVAFRCVDSSTSMSIMPYTEGVSWGGASAPEVAPPGKRGKRILLAKLQLVVAAPYHATDHPLYQKQFPRTHWLQCKCWCFFARVAQHVVSFIYYPAEDGDKQNLSSPHFHVFSFSSPHFHVFSFT